ncbi:MAG: serine hydrolase domain-containing protein [Chloroflexota bacterium]
MSQQRPHRLGWTRLRAVLLATSVLVASPVVVVGSGVRVTGVASPDAVAVSPAAVASPAAIASPAVVPVRASLAAPVMRQDASAPVHASASAPTPTPAPAPTHASAPRHASAPTPALVTGPIPSDALQAALDQFRARYGIPGLSATIIWPDGRAWSGASGYANIRARTRVTRSTPFAVGSITKTFTAALIVKLAEEKRLGLDDPVVRWLPTAPVDPAVTIRQLLDHTSGVYDFFANRLIDPALVGAKRRVWTPALDLRYVKEPYFAPGTGWHYSNTNYVLLGLIARRAGGASVAAQLRSRFFQPLRLLSATYQGAELPRVPVAHGYTFATSSVSARPIDQSDGTAIAPFTSVTTAAGDAGALAASSWDLARWARALYGGRVLRPESLAAMLDVSRTVAFGPPRPYGFAVQQVSLGGWTAVGHSGRLLGTRAVMRYFTDSRIAIAVTTNQSRTDPDRLVAALVGIILPPPVAPPPAPPVGASR